MSQDDARQFAQRVLSMPDDVAVGFLEQWHARTCKCGQSEDGRKLLASIRQKWAGRLEPIR